MLARRSSLVAAVRTRSRATTGNRLSSSAPNKQHSFKIPHFSNITRNLSQLVDEWRILQDETDLLLSTPSVRSNDIIIDVLTRWQSHPNAQQAATGSNDLLFHWLESVRNNNITTAEPFLLTMKAWNRVGNAQKAADVLELWVQLLEGDLELAPTLEAHHVLLECFAKLGIVEESLAMLQYLERMQSAGSLTLQPPNVETFANVVTCLARTTDERNERWEQMLTIMKKLDNAQQQGPRGTYFRLQAYSHAVCYAVATDRRDDALALLQKGLSKTSSVGVLKTTHLYWEEHMQQDDAKSSPAHLVGIAYQAVLSKLSKEKAPQQMHALLTQLEDFSSANALPWPQHYAMTVDAWSNTCTNDKDDEVILATASRCEELLKRMEERQFSTNSDKMISFGSYERVLWMYGRVREPAERLLAHVMNLLEKYPDKLIVSDDTTLTAAWNHVLKAFHLTNRHDKVLRLWQRMDTMNVKSDSITTEVVLKALSHTRQQDAPELAEQVLRIMNDNERTAAHYEAAVVTWSRSKKRGAAASAQALLEELEQLYDNAVERLHELRPTVSIYNSVIAAHARRKNQAAAQQVLDHMLERAKNDDYCPLPNSDSFAVILDGLSRQRSRTAAAKAEELLASMESSEEAKPNKECYTSVMTAIVRSGDGKAPERVMQIYERMLDSCDDEGDSEIVRPDVVTYGILLDMWAKSRRQDAGELAEQILRDMQSNGLNANVVNYNNAILAYARSNRADSFDRAKDLLVELQESSLEGDESVKPNTVTYTNVIQSLKRSAEANKAEAARNLFQEMSRRFSDGDADVQPNVITVNSVLTACAFTRGDDETRRRAVQIALTIFSEMEKLEITPNSNSFRMLLETFGRQVADMTERTKMAEVAFQRCQREGLVDAVVVETLQKFLPPMYEELLHRHRSTMPAQSDQFDDRQRVDRPVNRHS